MKLLKNGCAFRGYPQGRISKIGHSLMFSKCFPTCCVLLGFLERNINFRIKQHLVFEYIFYDNCAKIYYRFIKYTFRIYFKRFKSLILNIKMNKYVFLFCFKSSNLVIMLQKLLPTLPEYGVKHPLLIGPFTAGL